jgi:hypothetical protein
MDKEKMMEEIRRIEIKMRECEKNREIEEE